MCAQWMKSQITALSKALLISRVNKHEEYLVSGIYAMLLCYMVWKLTEPLTPFTRKYVESHLGTIPHVSSAPNTDLQCGVEV